MTTKQTALQRLKEVCEKATPEPWIFKDGLTWLPTASGGIEHDDSAICHGKNGEFIAAARTALPELINYCEALEEALKGDPLVSADEAIAIESARAMLEEVCQQCCP